MAVVLAVIAATGIPSASADDVSDQQRRVEQLADDLDALEQRLGQLDEDYAATLDRLDALTIEIADAQARVDAQSGELELLQRQLTTIAIDKFTSGGASGLTPLFSTAQSFIDDLERNELTRVAFDQGAGTTDEMLQLVEQLTLDRQRLDQRKAEQAALLASLEAQQAEGEALTVELQRKFRDAEAELGQLIVEEQERRVAAAAADARAEWEAAAAAAQRPAGSSGGNNGGNDGGNGEGARGGGAAPADSGSGNGGAAPAVTAAPEAPSVPAPASTAGIAVAAAQSQLGVPYKFAKSEPGVAFDCSGLTKYAWGKAGVNLPHQSRAQYASTTKVPQDQAQPGDLIFYYAPIGHVAIYIGGGMMIHAPASGDVVKVSAVNWDKVVGVSRPG
jgi:peptidoglycan DL-endopeptidase CwlO